MKAFVKPDSPFLARLLARSQRLPVRLRQRPRNYADVFAERLTNTLLGPRDAEEFFYAVTARIAGLRAPKFNRVRRWLCHFGQPETTPLSSLDT